MRVLGLDVGEKRIGIAKGDTDTRIAIPVGYILADGSEWQRLARYAELFGASAFVVGLPRNNEGAETKQSLYARNFAKTLSKKLPKGIDIVFQDESLTSVVAEERLRARKKNFEKGEIDAEAAAVILQDYLETADALPRKKQKSHHGWVKFLTVVGILAVLGGVGVAVALKIKDDRANERAEYYRQLEAEMVAETFDFTIAPGETVFDVKERLIEAGYTENEAKTALNPRNYDYSFLAGVDSLEGYLFGETYNFYRTASAEEIIAKYLDGMATVISENDLENRFGNQGLSLREGIILASIVQKEAHTADQPTVAQVFLSRLSYGIPLGSDVTVSYAIDVVDPDRKTYADNQAALKIDSCYNTRLYAGLPCGPISNPSLSALIAVAEPSDTTYFYFLTGDDGIMYYSYTEAEHIQKIRQYCQELCNVSL